MTMYYVALYQQYRRQKMLLGLQSLLVARVLALIKCDLNRAKLDGNLRADKTKQNKKYPPPQGDGGGEKIRCVEIYNFTIVTANPLFIKFVDVVAQSL